MATLPSTAALDLDFSRLSLAPSPYSYPSHSPHPAQSPLDRSALSPSATGTPTTSSHNLAPHQVMQPPLHSGPPPHVQLQEPQRRRGVVKFFNSLKGFGFVVDNEPGALGGQEVFCHFSAISGKGGFRSLAEGEEVEYELVQGPKGFQAANLTGPGGRTVVGDPKARMQKPPAYLPFAPMALPLGLGGAPYLADPYAQHGAVYAAAGSPYTSHVLYVPATASLPPSQYAYAPVPLAAHAPPQQRGAPPPGAAAGQPPASLSAASPFAAPQYQSYAAAPPSGALNGAGGVAPQVGGGAHSASPPPPVADRYAALTRIGAATGAYGAPAPASAGERASPYAAAGSNGASQGFSPPLGAGANGAGAFPPSTPGGTAAGAGAPAPAFGGFAPFSPPSFSHAPLFGAPPQGYSYAPPQGAPAPSQAPQQAQQTQQGQPSTPSSALFGSIPAPIGSGSSRSGTPLSGVGGVGRSATPLGNGSLGSDAWK
ncbi:hypothetical protein JCM10207_005692 [Rhodosporidiobolus poonsookiae]